MAAFVLTNESVVINGVDLSDHVKSATLVVSADQIDSTAMSSGGWKSYVGGLKVGSLTLTLNQDHAAGSVDATLWAAFGTVVAFTVKPVAGATSATNPAYSGSVLIAEHQPVGSGLGELSAVGITLPTSGTVTRATA